MTLEQVQDLRPGDQVTWNDPDWGACTRSLIISTIHIEDNDAVLITDENGDDLQAWPQELS